MMAEVHKYYCISFVLPGKANSWMLDQPAGAGAVATSLHGSKALHTFILIGFLAVMCQL